MSVHSERTVERVLFLKNQGLLYSLIAESMGFETRNVVAGIINRNKKIKHRRKQ